MRMPLFVAALLLTCACAQAKQAPVPAPSPQQQVCKACTCGAQCQCGPACRLPVVVPIGNANRWYPAAARANAVNVRRGGLRGLIFGDSYRYR